MQQLNAQETLNNFSFLTLYPALEYSWNSLMFWSTWNDRKSHVEMNRKVWLDSVQEQHQQQSHRQHKKEETTYCIIAFLDQVRPGYSEKCYMVT